MSTLKNNTFKEEICLLVFSFVFMKGETMKELKKILCVLGETARGKDTFAKILEKDYGLRSVVSYTTRPIRPGEIDGREHYFITKEKADNMFFTNPENIVAYTAIGKYEYFATKAELLKSDIYIIDPVGYDRLKSTVLRHKIPVSLIGVYITCSPELARKRAELRGDDLIVFDRRSIDERDRFVDFDYYERYGYKYTNDKTLDDLKEFARDIMKIM